ncbi:type II CRISPR RNA-guided endonuclease Cas9 [Paremcibacter congregatus]|uniref:CRISPR-associated endonuclease Cas9 n=1 Tax=Paremcibacter congregatus TaxID=2043170 RepID=A0A2G4YRY6_9PROT|nr:type II CRISPR RNA-guided endonuclease Cas9 [Paremcibacter congregatus]PHZ85085.1 type II CRISPR RNA-guided endonuclease Cas9 [Paremcibacter congregatus]QDE27965.1 type II CRISPR RNA-guided endonuclease Cas9 [Paremcibacter congregatus]QHI06648.1 CRISPR-associated endonuclease Cas9 [Paremcibacter congregatus]
MSYNLGVDIGIASVGFAGVNLNAQNILCSGVHIFEAAENPKTGASLAEPRRTKRGMRRVFGRRSQRKRAVRRMLIEYGIDNIDAIDVQDKRHNNEKLIKKSPWDLRKESLERILTDAEFSRVLFHIAKRRGYQSNRKGAIANDTEGKKALSGAVQLQEAMVQSGAETVGAYLATLDKKRNGHGSYDNFVTRDLLRQEVRKIFAAQRRYGNIKASRELEHAFAGNGEADKKYTLEGSGIAFCQRDLQSSIGMVGYCTLEPSEKRAPKFSYSAELFILWSKLNNAKIRDTKSNERVLSQDEKNKLTDLAHKNKSGVSFKQARKILNLSDDMRFNMSYRKINDRDDTWEKVRDRAEKSVWLILTGYQTLKSKMATGSDDDWQQWTGPRRNSLDEISHILSFYESEQEIRDLLAPLELQEDQISSLLTITNFSRTIDLSLKVVRAILPFMQKGLTYDKACREAGYNHSQKENKGLTKIPSFKDVRNPVVNRALAQTRKVMNAVIAQYGMPETIIIEMARDVGRSFKERKDKERDQKTNQSYREAAKKHAAEILDIDPDNVRGGDIIKYRLWKEQKGFCPYSGVYINHQMMRDPVATQIDHIIPYSRSWNDSYMNKILCCTDENQMKANNTPVEYFQKQGRNLKTLSAFAKGLPKPKADNLLIENFDEEKANKWKDRALNDTRYIAKLLKNHVEQSLGLGIGNRVQARNGALTSHLRSAWGFPDKNRRNDTHHAIDAIVLACSTQSMVQNLTRWNKYEARRKNPHKRALPPKPWESFIQDTKDAVEHIFVSRMPVRKVTGPAHQDTIRSIRKDDGKIIQRIKVADLKPDMLERMVHKERNIRLYTVLKKRLDAHKGDPKKAFATPIFMPTNDPGKQGPLINAVRIETIEKSGVLINGGLASNGDMVRVDVFRKNGKFFLVPIYVHHFVGGTLPNRAIIAYKPEGEWEEMEDKDFIFSLCKNDLLFIKSKKDEYFGYYGGTDISTGAIGITAHNRDPSFGKKGDGKDRTGVKTLQSFEKYTVDYFGNKYKVRKETRLGVAHNSHPEPCKT